jgi:predicted nucleic-acid-binding protein
VPQRKRAEPPAARIPLVDTNVLIRFLIGDDPPKAAKAKALMQRVEGGDEAVDLVEGVVVETVWTLERHYKVPRLDIAQRLAAILSYPGIRSRSRGLLLQALQTYATLNVDFVDCLLAARSKDRSAFVYTFDETDFKKLGADWKTP